VRRPTCASSEVSETFSYEKLGVEVVAVGVASLPRTTNGEWKERVKEGLVALETARDWMVARRRTEDMVEVRLQEVKLAWVLPFSRRGYIPDFESGNSKLWGKTQLGNHFLAYLNLGYP